MSFLEERPERLLGERAYDSDPLEGWRRTSGEGHRDSNFRRLVVRYERRAENYLGFARLGYIVILLRYL